MLKRSLSLFFGLILIAPTPTMGAADATDPIRKKWADHGALGRRLRVEWETKAHDLDGWPTSEQARGLLEQKLYYVHPTFAKFLDGVLGEEAIVDFLSKRVKKAKDPNRLARHPEGVTRINEYARKAALYARSRKNTLVSRLRDLGYGVDLLESNGIIALRFHAHPQYVVKMQLFRWPVFVGGQFHSKQTFPWQLLSRVLAAEELNAILTDPAQDFHHLIPVSKWIHHIPGKPDDLHDDNYLVVAHHVPLADYTTLSLSDLPPESPLWKEIERATKRCGLWDVANHGNVLVWIDADGKQKGAIVDLERPGLGGGDEGTEFFHHNPERIARNGDAGVIALEKRRVG